MLAAKLENILKRIRSGGTTVTDAADVEILLKALGYIIEAYLSDGNVWRAVAHARQVWRQVGGRDDEETGGE
jgi:hypothetical protein